ncbi:hypothetical protein EVAR_8420_1 [Eumeta japonica]|uniref:Uncharacterized protein n=1 Tax=Eumeta variegata TaxID=151549 RepID=A0A4C1WEB7_EUMVA|nr:hypothetical protein EVAR_8420_1 [Eumeta japonica]
MAIGTGPLGTTHTLYTHIGTVRYVRMRIEKFQTVLSRRPSRCGAARPPPAHGQTLKSEIIVITSQDALAAPGGGCAAAGPGCVRPVENSYSDISHGMVDPGSRARQAGASRVRSGGRRDRLEQKTVQIKDAQYNTSLE